MKTTCVHCRKSFTEPYAGFASEFGAHAVCDSCTKWRHREFMNTTGKQQRMTCARGCDCGYGPGGEHYRWWDQETSPAKPLTPAQLAFYHLSAHVQRGKSDNGRIVHWLNSSETVRNLVSEMVAAVDSPDWIPDCQVWSVAREISARVHDAARASDDPAESKRAYAVAYMIDAKWNDLLEAASGTGEFSHNARTLRRNARQLWEEYEELEATAEHLAELSGIAAELETI